MRSHLFGGSFSESAIIGPDGTPLAVYPIPARVCRTRLPAFAWMKEGHGRVPSCLAIRKPLVFGEEDPISMRQLCRKMRANPLNSVSLKHIIQILKTVNANERKGIGAVVRFPTTLITPRRYRGSSLKFVIERLHELQEGGHKMRVGFYLTTTRIAVSALCDTTALRDWAASKGFDGFKHRDPLWGWVYRPFCPIQIRTFGHSVKEH